MEKLKKWLSDRIVWVVLVIWGIALLGLGIAVACGLDVGKAGQFGDSFGLINTLFSGLAFAMLVVTLWRQSAESEKADERHRKMQLTDDREAVRAGNRHRESLHVQSLIQTAEISKELYIYYRNKFEADKYAGDAETNKKLAKENELKMNEALSALREWQKTDKVKRSIG